MEKPASNSGRAQKWYWRKTLLELFLGEADALSIGGGEEEVLGRPLHRQGYPCRAVLLDGL
ncbi:hypothetical protein NE579_16240, partial [Intestinimonas massiliensis]|nr:hypothetical protein [Intestinimonas massiliensis (ex Afouda et al. 2020)]